MAGSKARPPHTIRTLIRRGERRDQCRCKPHTLILDLASASALRSDLCMRLMPPGAKGLKPLARSRALSLAYLGGMPLRLNLLAGFAIFGISLLGAMQAR